MFRLKCLLLSAWILSPLPLYGQDEPEKPPAIRALLVTGGCCHDYERQVDIVTHGISRRAHVVWEIYRGSRLRDIKPAIYQTDHWSQGFDIVVHNECFGGVTDVDFVERIVRGHVSHQIPAVVIHCSMHSYRNAKTDEWRKLVGVTSRRHEKGGQRLDVVNRDQEHPIMKHFPGSWKTPNGELYVIERAWPECQILATAYGIGTEEDHPVIWTNRYQGAKVFGTTLGHHNETMDTDEWLGVVTRGLLWACDRLGEDGEPLPGYEPARD